LRESHLRARRKQSSIVDRAGWTRRWKARAIWNERGTWTAARSPTVRVRVRGRIVLLAISPSRSVGSATFRITTYGRSRVGDSEHRWLDDPCSKSLNVLGQTAAISGKLRCRTRDDAGAWVHLLASSAAWSVASTHRDGHSANRHESAFALSIHLCGRDSPRSAHIDGRKRGMSLGSAVVSEVTMLLCERNRPQGGSGAVRRTVIAHAHPSRQVRAILRGWDRSGVSGAPERR